MSGDAFITEEAVRLKVGLRRVESMWYVVVKIWDNEDASGPPMDERAGPAGGLATQAEALIFYHEKVKPITDLIIAAHEGSGGTTEHLIKQVLH